MNNEHADYFKRMEEIINKRNEQYKIEIYLAHLNDLGFKVFHTEKLEREKRINQIDYMYYLFNEDKKLLYFIDTYNETSFNSGTLFINARKKNEKEYIGSFSGGISLDRYANSVVRGYISINTNTTTIDCHLKELESKLIMEDADEFPIELGYVAKKFDFKNYNHLLSEKLKKYLNYNAFKLVYEDKQTYNGERVGYGNDNVRNWRFALVDREVFLEKEKKLKESKKRQEKRNSEKIMKNKGISTSIKKIKV